jgi:3-hydroxymyristoyl/3-hydroxydecanoyl-(acyl carrier protein) dehydratase
MSPVIAAFADAQTASAKAHESFLAVSRKLAELQARVISGEAVLPAPASYQHVPEHVDNIAVPRALTREQCMEFAIGSIAKVLGPRFAAADAYPTRVRLPDEPLMLVDRITEIEGEPQSMGKGRVVTEHDVKSGAWYLDNGRIPTCVAVEAGQADLFLSGYLGIDDKTQGLAVYRLLDAEVTFHGALPKPGEVIRYDIRIDRFIKHGDAWLFFFHYDGTVDGKPLITMRNGCAGFFSQEELAAGKGIVLTADEKKPVAGKGDFTPLAPLGGKESYDDAQLNALRDGDLSLFGFNVPFTPLTIPKGKMNLVHRINELDPKGGRYGKGWIRGEADIHPDDWHLVCHFKDDNVMPGTLMYECCLHTMRVLLMRLGIVGDAAKCVHEPVAGVKSKLKCRGQVLAHTKKVHYEISIKELGYNPAPYAIADALMFSDGKPIVHITDMSLQLTGATRPELEALRLSTKSDQSENGDKSPRGKRKPLFDHERILQYAIGKPSEAFGTPYEIFDEDRIIARLPGPPYQFLDRIVDIQGCKPFELAAGGRIEAEYDVPRDAWYFKSHRQATMPFAILLEAALQPCGWFAAYLGSALTSPIDLKFRNLGGTATQHREVTPKSGTLRTSIAMTKVAQAGGMIIQNYSMKVRDDKGLVYEGVTEFGFFTAEALGSQLGIRGAKLYAPSAEHLTTAIRPSLEDLRPYLPDPMLLMLDEVELYPEAGAKRLGFVKGRRKVNPSEWFFKAHFYQDPVCPGSLGLESFVELLKAFAATKWPSKTSRYETMVLGKPHTWLYRGQYTPVNKQVEVQAVITSIEEASKTVVADGFLTVDGLTIYSMKDFSLRLT